MTGVNEGRPLFVRKPDAHFNLANFMRTHLYAALATLKIGLDILLKEEKVKVDRIYGHGGLFKTKGVGQGILAAAMDAPVAVMETAGEGGPWGMALLASYMLQKADGESLEQYLSEKVFGGESGSVMEPDPADVAGFDAYIKAYKRRLQQRKRQPGRCRYKTGTKAADSATPYSGIHTAVTAENKYISWREHYVSNKKLQVLVLHRITGSLRR